MIKKICIKIKYVKNICVQNNNKEGEFVNDIWLYILIALISIVSCIIVFFILVLIGNLSAMKFLAKHGVAVFSNNIEKDSKLLNYVNKESVCWLSIPNICYSPIMRECNGKYKNHNFLQKESFLGELYISESIQSKVLKEKENLKTNSEIADLTIIQGSPFGKPDLRHSNFSRLRKIEEQIKQGGNKDILICENGNTRKFKAISLLEMSIGEKHTLKYTDRNDFIQSILDMSKLKSINYVPKENVVILECRTDIDIVIVLLVEKEGV